MYINNVIEQYNLNKKIIIYLRKSREEMIGGGYGGVEFTLERHEEILQNWAIQNLGAKIPEENIFREVGSGETINSRPVMTEILKLIKNNDISAVLIIEPQRTSRGDLRDCQEIIDSFSLTDTKVLTPQKIYDLTDKYDKKMFRDELLRGSEYLEYTKEILSRGRQLSVSQGKLIGQAPFGYDKEKLKDTKGFTAVPNKDSETVKLIYKMFLEGNTPYQIASHLRAINANTRTDKEWEHGAVKQILLNPFYYGYQTWQARKTTKMFVNGEIKTVRLKNEEVEIYKGLHTPLISEKEYIKTQEMLKTRSIPHTKSNLETQNPLAGIIKCGVCGRSMVRQVHTGKFMKKRKHSFDKREFQDFLKSQKEKYNIKHKEIYTKLDIPSHYVYGWFGTPEKFYPSGIFIDKWFELKKILKIKTTKYDKPLTEFTDIKKPDTLACIYHNCNNTSSHLHLVENEILQVISARLENYRNYLDNYEFEYIKEIENNENIIKHIEKEISGLNKELKTATRNYNREDFTREEYLDIKSEITSEIEALEAKRKALNTNKEENVIVVKKSIPILENCLKKYPGLKPKDKNKLLKTILKEVYYSKINKGSDFKITPTFKI